MDAIVTAGGIPQPGEPLYEVTRGHHKALLELCGQPMIQWVLDALGAAQTIERVLVIGLTDQAGLRCARPLSFIPNQGEMLENILVGIKHMMKLNPVASHVLLVSSDIPTITPQTVDWLTRTVLSSEHDLYYNVISRQVMEARFPGSKRTYTALKDVEVCGGDMNAVRASAANDNALWRKIITARKSPFKQAALFGFDTLLLFLFRQVTLEAAVQRISKRIGLRGRAILCPYAEIGMDVDKPHQLDLARADLERQLRGG